MAEPLAADPPMSDGGSEPVDLASWLLRVGAPESITSMLPKEVRAVDMSALIRMFGQVEDMMEHPESVFGRDEIGEDSPHSIKWLPITIEK